VDLSLLPKDDKWMKIVRFCLLAFPIEEILILPENTSSLINFFI
jgi:hypothetical protein